MLPRAFPPPSRTVQAGRIPLRGLAPTLLYLAALWPGLMASPQAQPAATASTSGPATTLRARLGADGHLDVQTLTPDSASPPQAVTSPSEALSTVIRPIDRPAARSLDELLGNETPAKVPPPLAETAAPVPIEPPTPTAVPVIPASPTPRPPVVHPAPEIAVPDPEPMPQPVEPAPSHPDLPVSAASAAAPAAPAASAVSPSALDSVKEAFSQLSPGATAAVAVGVGVVLAGAAAMLGAAGTVATATTAAATAAAAGTGVSWLSWVASFIQKFIAKIIANPLEWLLQQFLKNRLIKFFKLEHVLTPKGLWRTLKARIGARFKRQRDPTLPEEPGR